MSAGVSRTDTGLGSAEAGALVPTANSSQAPAQEAAPEAEAMETGRTGDQASSLPLTFCRPCCRTLDVESTRERASSQMLIAAPEADQAERRQADMHTL